MERKERGERVSTLQVVKRRGLYRDGKLEGRIVPPALAGAAQLRATLPVPSAGKNLCTKKTKRQHSHHAWRTASLLRIIDGSVNDKQKSIDLMILTS